MRDASSFGIEPYKMYLKNQHVDLSDSEQRARIRQINQNRDESLLALTYNELENIHHIFSDTITSEKMARYVDIDNTYPWLQYVRGNISEYETMDFETKLESVFQIINASGCSSYDEKTTWNRYGTSTVQ